MPPAGSDVRWGRGLFETGCFVAWPIPRSVHPLNTLDYDKESDSLECWHNGGRCYTVYVGGQLAAAVASAQGWFRKWSGGEGKLSRELEDMMTPRCPECGYSATDALLHGDHHLCNGTIPERFSRPCVRCDFPTGSEDWTLCEECMKDPGDDSGFDQEQP